MREAYRSQVSSELECEEAEVGAGNNDSNASSRKQPPCKPHDGWQEPDDRQGCLHFGGTWRINNRVSMARPEVPAVHMGYSLAHGHAIHAEVANMYTCCNVPFEKHGAERADNLLLNLARSASANKGIL